MASEFVAHDAEPHVYLDRDDFEPSLELAHIRGNGCPVQVLPEYGVPAWLVTREADVRRILADPAIFSNDRMVELNVAIGTHMAKDEIDRLKAGQPLAYDPPEHTRLRRFLQPYFTVKRIRKLEPRVEEIVDERLAVLERKGPPADLVRDFALPIPSLVICELLGVPYGDRDEFQSATAGVLDARNSPEVRARHVYRITEYMQDIARKALTDHGDDILGSLAAAHGDELSLAELAGIGNTLLLAGHETTANMIAMGTLALLRNPQQRAIVVNQPDVIGPAVEELLRWLTVVNTPAVRSVKRDVEISGLKIKMGDLVLVSLPSANRDPDFIEDPERLNVARGQFGHLAFGHGPHHCVGSPLARMELRLALPALLRRLPRLAEVPGGTWFKEQHIIHGLTKMEVTW